jgi:geranylgeranyl pyrophosphate synthase
MLSGDQEKVVTLAAAIEMLHTATLVHDDLIDGSLLRRGIPTLNSQWSPGATVLTGDFIFATAARLAAETGSVEVMRLFAETLMTIVNGEITQMFSSRGIASRENYYQRIYAKTASMFELASSAAAVLSPVDLEVRAAVRQFGYEIGMAFQILDDILDFTAEPTKLGKPVASDLRQGLITLPAIYYLERSPEDPDLQKVLKGRSDEKGLPRLVEAIRQSGAIQSSLEEARRFVERGVASLEGLPQNPARRSLEELAFYIVDRDL